MVYFCHKCDRQVPHAMEQPNGELLCSVCLEPFVEILEEDQTNVENRSSVEANEEQQRQQPNVSMSFHFHMHQAGGGSVSSIGLQMPHAMASLGLGRADRRRLPTMPPFAPRIRPFAMPIPSMDGADMPFLDMSDGIDSFDFIFGGDLDAEDGEGHVQVGDFVMGDFNELLAQMHRQHEDQGKPPATEKAINQLHTRTLTKEDENQLADQQCAICQDKFLAKEEVTCLPCDHTYHKDCVVPWLSRHCTCPVCRSEVKELNPLTSNSPENIMDV